MHNVESDTAGVGESCRHDNTLHTYELVNCLFMYSILFLMML
jgi:hypothetical protein